MNLSQQRLMADEDKPALGFGEFIALMAMMISLVAMSIDAMLPALSEIGKDLAVQRDNNTQLIISLFILGIAVGQIIYGPLSDSIGRKPAAYAGFCLFMIGCLLSIFALNFGMMLAGRIIQGLGLAGPRTVTMAIVRDRYEGRVMARVMSSAPFFTSRAFEDEVVRLVMAYLETFTKAAQAPAARGR